MHVTSNVSNRFAHTTVTSRVKNIATKSQEATFSIVLPETAFISGFIMEVDGKNYTAYVKEKEEAKKDYDQAVARGLGAAHVAVSARDSNRFTVSVNVEPETKAAFYLTYEELLKRDDGHYEQVINLHPGQPVKDLSVEVLITESRKIIDLKALPLRSGNEIGDDKGDLDPRADLAIINDKTAVVKFSPNIERQKQLAHVLGTNEDEGLAGQFVVQYDVERDPNGGEVLIQDGYFVHFFAPTELAPLPKHVVFVLDTSSSMWGQKIEQLKEAMNKILEQLHNNDLFSLVEFNSNVKVWDLNNAESSVWYPTSGDNFNFRDKGDEVSFEGLKFPSASVVNPDNIKNAKDTISQLVPGGGTDILTALRVSLHLVELAKDHKVDEVNRQPIIVFLTDGDPTVRLTSTEEISNKISEYNVGLRRSPIFALSFGSGADRDFLQKLALRNSGFSKHIYDAADAALQLEDFYRQISSPLLANVTFKYEPSVTSLTKTEFPIHFEGSEIVVSGWRGTDLIEPPVIHGWGVGGKLSLKPAVIERSVSNVERLWAYMQIKQLLEKKETADKDKEDLKKKALDLALKYSFVTPVSSLVVVKPNATNAVDTEAATGGSHVPGYPLRAFSAAGPPAGYNSYKFAQPIFDDFSQQYPSPPAYPAFSRIPAAVIPSLAFASPNAEEEEVSVEEETTQAADLLTILPWLKTILNDNGILDLPSGKYKLGLNETITDSVDCPKTPLNEAGHCSLLHSCPQVHSLLISSDVFVQHVCILKNEYAGVCCPNDS
ncbi:hypothetical protein ILUMI_20315 [Ignelater luminosus]|uniref:Inter-alpha-trypsin inhibitor heavy chain H4-like n=1 Tax=Ignelater luminosus TaxID=2038154 RepID=A0A8K0CJY6_IGNLU|nr:hypothetical protein ILUMI_20315 [Ignelater luminosus]